MTEVGYTGAADGSFAVAFAAMAVGYICIAIWEESIFRGLFVTDGTEGLGRVSPRASVTIASLLAATVFSLLHFQQAPSAVSLLFWIGMGCVLAFAYALTGELAVPIGLHFAYNFAGNTIFGITGVVTDEQPTLVRLAFTGPEAFVQLAGVVNSLFVGVAFVLVLAWVRWYHGELRLQTSLATWRSE